MTLSPPKGHGAERKSRHKLRATAVEAKEAEEAQEAKEHSRNSGADIPVRRAGRSACPTVSSPFSLSVFICGFKPLTGADVQAVDEVGGGHPLAVGGLELVEAQPGLASAGRIERVRSEEHTSELQSQSNL